MNNRSQNELSVKSSESFQSCSKLYVVVQKSYPRRVPSQSCSKFLLVWLSKRVIREEFRVFPTMFKVNVWLSKELSEKRFNSFQSFNRFIARFYLVQGTAESDFHKLRAPNMLA